MNALPILFVALMAGLPGEPVDGQATLEDLFRWGEYDSLIQALEPPRSSGRDDSLPGALASRADTLAEARAWMYLGVAYWAKGRPEQGAEAFAVAARLDGDLRLDPLYATPEMAERFARISESRRPGAASAAPASPPDGEAVQPPRPAPRRASWVRMAGAAAVGVAAAGAAAGVVYTIQSRKSPREVITVVDPE